MIGKKINFFMPGTFELLLFILTILATKAMVERTFSDLNRIKCFTRYAKSQKILKQLALM